MGHIWPSAKEIQGAHDDVDPSEFGAVHPLAWISWCRDKKPQAWEKACAKHRLHIWYYYILLSEEKSIKGYHGVFDWRERFPLQGNCYIIRILYHMLTLMLLESIRPKYCNQPGLMVKFGLTFHYSLHDCLRIVVHRVSFFGIFLEDPNPSLLEEFAPIIVL